MRLLWLQNAKQATSSSHENHQLIFSRTQIHLALSHIFPTESYQLLSALHLFHAWSKRRYRARRCVQTVHFTPSNGSDLDCSWLCNLLRLRRPPWLNYLVKFMQFCSVRYQLVANCRYLHSIFTHPQTLCMNQSLAIVVPTMPQCLVG